MLYGADFFWEGSTKDNPLKEKSYFLALDIVKLCREISKNTKEYVLINQLLKSGTSIGANIREAEFAQSKAGLTA
ncbi:MAG: four helix bundle protein [Spirochaetes bacterium]|nr:four helix bundle protein [Spirochaetota bacterium]